MTRSLDGDLSVVLGSGGGGGRYQMVFFYLCRLFWLLIGDARRGPGVGFACISGRRLFDFGGVALAF